MNLRDCLEMYNTDQRENSELLDRIYKNVSTEYFPNSNNKYIINKIVEAFKDVDKTLKRFEYENQRALSEIQKYILKCKIDDERIAEIQSIMKKWAIYFPGIGILPSIKDLLINRYRQEYIVKYLKKEKAKINHIIYLQYLLLVKKLWGTDKKSQIKVLEKYNEHTSKLLDCMIEYLFEINKENKLSIDGHIVISEHYIEGLKKEKLLLDTINYLYDKMFEEKSYASYKEDLKRIYIIQEDIENWIDISKLSNIIPYDNLKLLGEACLVDEVSSDYQRIIRLTAIGFSIITGHFVEKWESDKYFIETEDIVLIPYNYNPLIISKYIFDKNYILKGIDFLISLERKTAEHQDDD